MGIKWVGGVSARLRALVLGVFAAVLTVVPAFAAPSAPTTSDVVEDVVGSMTTIFPHWEIFLVALLVFGIGWKMVPRILKMVGR